ncbi:MAG TPA: phosphate signaling complex protein PhoU [Anaerolineales bacterium]|nr:phosphate signaling complex protein PhoU [Anaerolineales bacterium]
MPKKPPAARSTLDRELQGVQDSVLRMGQMVDAAIEKALKSLSERDASLARAVVSEDAAVNQLRFKTEEACLALIATQQPAARDLRTVVAAMNIVSDLERMADHAAGIARIVLMMGEEPLLKPLIDIPRMAEACRQMVRDSLEAFIERDADRAQVIAGMDDTVDGLYHQVFRELLSFMVEDPATTTRALYLLFVAHNLERIGDRATNIAERVVFMTSGEMRELNPEPRGTNQLG